MNGISESIAVILCGGESRRMGFDKAFLQIGADFLLLSQVKELQGLFQRVVLVTNSGEKLAHLALPEEVEILEDCYPKAGPVGAICTAFHGIREDWIFITACDMPAVNVSLIRQLWEQRGEGQVVLCRHGEKEEPLFAFYHRDCVPTFQRQLSEGQRKLRASFHQLRLSGLELSSQLAAQTFYNLNTPQELEDYIKEKADGNS